jgi:hypothetical protein
MTFAFVKLVNDDTDVPDSAQTPIAVDILVAFACPADAITVDRRWIAYSFYSLLL